MKLVNQIRDAVISGTIGVVAFWYAKCPAPKLYRWVTNKFI